LQFYPGASLHSDPTSTWVPNETALRSMLEEAGFRVESQLQLGQRGIATADRIENPAAEQIKDLDRSVGLFGARPGGPADAESSIGEIGAVEYNGAALAPAEADAARSDHGALPLPPLEMRKMVGPTDPSLFDNPSGVPVFPDLPPHAYESIFDFGCGCGRVARQLIQQNPRPGRYLGVDLHPALVKWCQDNLSPHAPEFEFRHHDVIHPTRNAGIDKPEIRPLEAASGEFSLVLAHSVFTHLVEAQAEYYFSEAARILSPTGILASTWFLFDKRGFPMMQDFQNALYLNDLDPTNAVIFDRNWLVDLARRHGLTIFSASPPAVRGFQWAIQMAPTSSGIDEVAIPEDRAPFATDSRYAPHPERVL
jgi:SAM-dependent methyltransferase